MLFSTSPSSVPNKEVAEFVQHLSDVTSPESALRQHTAVVREG